ncbi:MAG TPA: hypothetical protein PLY93_05985 [Turneriella sp.]|nr:hypothetical protein [Turneriella sp.]
MAKTITARIDDTTEKQLARLALKLHQSESQVIRRSIESLAALELNTKRKPKKIFYGLGEYDSGIADLGTNKAYLHDFGR